MNTSANTNTQIMKKITMYNNLILQRVDEEIGSYYCCRCMSWWLDQAPKTVCPVCGRKLYDFRNEVYETLLQIIDTAQLDSRFPTMSCTHCGTRNFADGSFTNCRLCKALLPPELIKKKSIWSRIEGWIWGLFV